VDKLSKTQSNLRKKELEKHLSLSLKMEINPILFSAKTGEGKETIWQEILKLTS
jgi:GTP-binding protein EngB required for normal cell division